MYAPSFASRTALLMYRPLILMLRPSKRQQRLVKLELR